MLSNPPIGHRAKRYILDPHIVLRYVLCSAVFLVLFVTNQSRGIIPFYGDEPHYLVTVESIVEDLDFNGANQYRNNDTRKFGYDGLGPQNALGFVPEDQEFYPPEHGFGFPLVIALPYKFFGLDGTRLFLSIIAFLSAILAAKVCDEIAPGKWAGTFSAVVLTVSPTWQVYASRIYPEVFAGFLSVLALYSVLKTAKGAWGIAPPIVAGITIGFLPILYLKYSPIGLALLLGSLSIWKIRHNKYFYFSIITVALFFSFIWVRTYGLTIFAGTGAHSASFEISGAFQRFWLPWFDRLHGLLLQQPVYIFFFFYLPGSIISVAPNRKNRILWSIILSVLFYNGLHAYFNGYPSASFTGRYLAACMPIISVFISINLFSKFRYTENSSAKLLAAGFLALSAYILYWSIYSHRPIWKVPVGEWSRLFPEVWPAPAHHPGYPGGFAFPWVAQNFGLVLIFGLTVIFIMRLIRNRYQ